MNSLTGTKHLVAICKQTASELIFNFLNLAQNRLSGLIYNFYWETQIEEK